jgi:hypothetical protein
MNACVKIYRVTIVNIQKLRSYSIQKFTQAISRYNQFTQWKIVQYLKSIVAQLVIKFPIFCGIMFRRTSH